MPWRLWRHVGGTTARVNMVALITPSPSLHLLIAPLERGLGLLEAIGLPAVPSPA
jgi:hypothetical protein